MSCGFVSGSDVCVNGGPRAGCCDGHGGSWFCAVASMEVGHDKCSEAWRLERWHYHGGRSSASEVMVKVRITAMTGSSPATSGAMVTGDG